MTQLEINALFSDICHKIESANTFSELCNIARVQAANKNNFSPIQHLAINKLSQERTHKLLVTNRGYMIKVTMTAGIDDTITGDYNGIIYDNEEDAQRVLKEAIAKEDFNINAIDLYIEEV